MKQWGALGLFVLFSLWIVTSVAAVQQQKDKKKIAGIFTSAAEAGPDFQIQGEYEGEIAGQGKFGVQVVALGSGKFDVYFLGGGLPGAGWDQKVRYKVSAAREGEGPMAVISGMGYSGDITGAKLNGKTDKGAKFSFTKVERKSPTEGKKAPPGAIILFDGTNADHWTNGKIVEDNLLFCGTRTKKPFGLGTYHVEFRTPYRPAARGQGRGNSGVYLMGREIQVLDSFGLDGKQNECGAFYGRAAPRVNMCYPPLSWQTYDVVLKANDKGETVATVRHNGVIIHEDQPIGQKATAASAINLQNHGNPVVFRNVWFVPAAGKAGE